MTTALKFRNVDASPDDPVETWPFEGILAAVERGTLPDWRRLATAIQADPWGPVAHQVLEAMKLLPFTILLPASDRACPDSRRRGHGRDLRLALWLGGALQLSIKQG
jgi:hypothetical protein